jgi:hypothetical protein
VGRDRTGFGCPCIRSRLDATTSTLAAHSPMRSGSPFVIRRAIQHRAAFCGSRHVRAPCRRGCRQISAQQSKRARARIVYACRHAVAAPARQEIKLSGSLSFSLAGCRLGAVGVREIVLDRGPRFGRITGHGLVSEAKRAKAYILHHFMRWLFRAARCEVVPGVRGANAGDHLPDRFDHQSRLILMDVVATVLGHEEARVRDEHRHVLVRRTQD